MQAGLPHLRVLHELLGLRVSPIMENTQSFGPTQYSDHPCCGYEHVRLGPQSWTQEDEDARAEDIAKILAEFKRRQMSVRAKFKLDSYETSLQSDAEECRTLKFSAVCSGSEENKQFFKYTPYGQITLGTVNKTAWEKFELGKEYYLDFIPAN
jgi:hypothetical protein